MSGYTPGPWHAVSIRGSYAWRVTRDPANARGDIATVIAGLGSTSVEADASLIAAAPELLEALKQILTWADPFMVHALPGGIEAAREHAREIEAIRALLAKIEGD